MKVLGVREYVDGWANLSSRDDICVAGAILCYNGQLLLLDEGMGPGFYKNNALLIMKYDGADIMLRKLLPGIGGGPSDFWEAAIVEVGDAKKIGEQYVAVPKKIHYWDLMTEAFVPLVLDEDFIASERAHEVELSKAQAEIIEDGEVDPFESAFRAIEEYWSDKI